MLTSIAIGLVAASLGTGPRSIPQPNSEGRLAHQSDTAAGQDIAAEFIAEVRIHGNHLTPDDEIVRIAGLEIGAPFGPTTLDGIRRRLADAKRFQDIDVLKRYASIVDPSRIVLVIIVNEGAVRVDVPGIPDQPVRVVKRRGLTNLMYLPIFDAEDGYGLTFGVRAAYVGVTGRDGRVSFPLTWGGSKRAGAEFDRTFVAGPLTRIQVGSSIERRHNPAYDEDDDRKSVWARAERAMGPVRVGASTGWQRVSFAAIEDRVRSVGVDVTYDTRLDPVLPRNAVYATASWTRLHVESDPAIDRTSVEGRGYLGLVGQSVLVLRAQRDNANASLPPHLQSLLGGWSNLRGFEAGSFVGDTRVNGSLELRVPVSSPLSIGKFGLSAFVDTGVAYADGERLTDQSLHTGIGGGVWFAITAFRMGLSVAHGLGATTRVNFGAGLTF